MLIQNRVIIYVAAYLEIKLLLTYS